ncbi:hypothetical protein B0H10DRAFT_148702 [Mycena sp. CBHHK59/15]|nr:hypothetical protein B0H10DRAFT_148702 [Mycena sp. CBHHK59/15]
MSAATISRPWSKEITGFPSAAWVRLPFSLMHLLLGHSRPGLCCVNQQFRREVVPSERMSVLMPQLSVTYFRSIAFRHCLALSLVGCRGCCRVLLGLAMRLQEFRKSSLEFRVVQAIVGSYIRIAEGVVAGGMVAGGMVAVGVVWLDIIIVAVIVSICCELVVVVFGAERHPIGVRVDSRCRRLSWSSDAEGGVCFAVSRSGRAACFRACYLAVSRSNQCYETRLFVLATHFVLFSCDTAHC